MKFVHQDLGLIEDFTIAENFALSRSRAVSVAANSRRDDNARCRELLERFGLHLDATRRAAELTITEQVMVAVIRSVYADESPTKILVLDEATSGLPPEESDAVLRIIREVAGNGVAVLFVSHRLDEVVTVCDCTTVLRDGRVVAVDDTSHLDSGTLIKAMFGVLAGTPDAAPQVRAVARPNNEVALDVLHLRGGAVHDATFTLHRGEILGITGLLGCGINDLGRLLGGADHAVGGVVEVGGRAVSTGAPRRTRSAGVAYVPASRDVSVLKPMTIRDNLMLPDMSSSWRHGHLSRARERALVVGLLKDFGVVPPEPDILLGSLSGGNQQKVALAKALRREPDVLVLDDPCRGVDMAARRDIYRILRGLAESGLAVLLLTSEIEDVEALCARIVVMRNGRTRPGFGIDDMSMTDLTSLINDPKETL